MKILLIIILFIIGLALLAVFTDPQDFQISLRAPTPAPQPEIDFEFEEQPEVEITPTIPIPRLPVEDVINVYLHTVEGSGVSGVATILPLNSQSKVLVTIGRLGDFQANIRQGSCGGSNELVTDLENVNNYSSTSLIDYSINDLRGRMPLLLEINDNGIVSCGNL